MIHDSKAEALEARGLYRRAAARWAEVIMLANDDKAREQAAKRRAECIHKAARPPARQDNFGEMRKTISRAFKHPTKHTKPVTGDVKKEKQ